VLQVPASADLPWLGQPTSRSDTFSDKGHANDRMFVKEAIISMTMTGGCALPSLCATAALSMPSWLT
jgi:hypothetical protein